MEEAIKTKNRTKHSFWDSPTISITLPTRWEEMPDDMWIYVCRLLAIGIEPHVVGNYLVLRVIGEAAKQVPEMQLALAANQLDFIADAPASPCRPSKIGEVSAVDAEFHGVTFSQYLIADNCFQGILQNPENMGAADSLLNILYPRYVEIYPDSDADDNRFAARYIAIKWFTALKRLFLDTFEFLFKPADNGSSEPIDMRKVMRNQIRVLTGGDITKEEAVLQTETWSALQELDAKIEENEEIKKMK